MASLPPHNADRRAGGVGVQKPRCGSLDLRRASMELEEFHQKSLAAEKEFRRRSLEELRFSRISHKQQAVRYRGLNETKERIADRTESFRQRVAQLREEAATAPTSTTKADSSQSVVSMASRRMVVRDSSAGGHIRIDVTRSGSVEKRIVVPWTVVQNVEAEGLGCFLNKSGTVEFAPLQCESCIEVGLDTSIEWAPLRDGIVRLSKEGEECGYELGTGHTTQLMVLSDTVWPNQGFKEGKKSHAISDWHKQWLTVNDGHASTLIFLFLSERLHALWPWCRWAILAAVVRVLCEVAVSYMMVLFVDQVLLVATPDELEGGTRPSQSVLAACCVVTMVLKMAHAQSQWWIHAYRGAGKTREDLRKWVAWQMMWVDDEQMSLMPSHFMSASITGTESAVSCWVAAFALFERAVHFVFLTALIAYLVPYALPAFVLLPVVAAVVLKLRGTEGIEALVRRERDDRYLVSTLSDFIDGIPLFRAVDARDTARTLYNSAVMQSSSSHGDAINFHTWTDVLIQHLAAGLVGLLLFACSLLVSNGLGSPGELVLVLNGFYNATNDLIRISQALLQMVWSSASLREMAQMLGMPNDAHELANQTELESLDDFQDARRQRHRIAASLQAGGGASGEAPRAMRLTLSDMVSEGELLSVAERTAQQRRQRHVHLPLQTGYGGMDLLTASAAAPDELLSVEITLGGLTLVEGLTDGQGENLLKLLAGLLPMRMTQGKLQPTLPFVRYVFVPAAPTLVQGSILVNLLLGVSELACPSDQDAWLVAKLCGLPDAFRPLLCTWDVGRDGCHLPPQERQAVALARALLADPDVLLLHKPLRVFSPEQARPVATLLVDFVRCGGLQGLLRHRRNQPPPAHPPRRSAVVTHGRGDDVLAEAASVLDLSRQGRGRGEGRGAGASVPRMTLVMRDSDEDTWTMEMGPRPDAGGGVDLKGFEAYVAAHRPRIDAVSRSFRSLRRGAGGHGGGTSRKRGSSGEDVEEEEEMARLQRLVEVNRGHLNTFQQWTHHRALSPPSSSPDDPSPQEPRPRAGVRKVASLNNVQTHLHSVQRTLPGLVKLKPGNNAPVPRPLTAEGAEAEGRGQRVGVLESGQVVTSSLRLVQSPSPSSGLQVDPRLVPVEPREALTLQGVEHRSLSRRLAASLRPGQASNSLKVGGGEDRGTPASTGRLTNTTDTEGNGRSGFNPLALAKRSFQVVRGRAKQPLSSLMIEGSEDAAHSPV